MVAVRGASFVFAMALVACAAPATDDAESSEAAATSSSVSPSDPNATQATRTVYANLRSLDLGAPTSFDRRIIIGQQEADVSNRATNGLSLLTSDIERVTEKTPALVSYELAAAYPRSTTMFDAAGFRAGREQLRRVVLDKHRKGALASFVWHMRCPKTSDSERDLFAPADCPADYRMEELLERKPDGARGAHFDEWRAMLDEIADLMWSLKDDRGELVPILFRPFHEHTGAWFWWGRDNAPSAWISVWRSMVDYLERGRGLHNLLWVYCPAAPTDRNLVSAGGDFERFYPGDAYADVISFDRYDHDDGRFTAGFEADLSRVGAFASAHGKAAAVAEVGLIGMPASRNTKWFSETLFGSLTRRARGFSYVALWRNAPWEKFVPEPNDAAADDLRRLAADPRALFAGTHDLYRPLHEY